MFPFEEFWFSAVFGGVIGGLISVMFLKLSGKGAMAREMVGADNLNGSQKRPAQEHDERFC